MRALCLVGLLAVLVGCASDDEGGAGSSGSGDGDGDSCDVTAPTACPGDRPTYADVAPIFEEHCVTCHNGMPDEPCTNCWSLATYVDIGHWKSEIRGALVGCVMPPAEATTTLPNSDRMKILEWLRCDAPE